MASLTSLRWRINCTPQEVRHIAQEMLRWIRTEFRLHRSSPRRSLEMFPSGRRLIKVEVFQPAGDQKRSAVILLHGADGPGGRGIRYQRAASELAGRGYPVLIVHYFESTGTQWADRSAIGRNYVTWLDTISDAVAYALHHTAADGGRIGLVGISLGASLALAEASRNHRIGAVAELGGAIPTSAAAFVERMPPVLIAHGADDSVVPAENAIRLAALLEARGIPHASCIYPGQGHIPDGAVVRDWIRQVAGFLSMNLDQCTVSRALADSAR